MAPRDDESTITGNVFTTLPQLIASLKHRSYGCGARERAALKLQA